MNNTQLVQYVEKIYRMESLIYSQKEICNQLLNKSNQLARDNGENLIVYKTDDDNYSDLYLGGGFFGGICGVVVMIILGVFTNIKLNIGIFSGLLLFFILGAIAGIILTFILGVQKSNDIEDINQKIREDNKNIQIRNSKLKENNQKKINLIQQEINIISTNYKNLQHTLNLYYGKNIIFPKYRGLIPISSFHEYLRSGRCNQLEGHEGAYNIYETEFRQNLIILKLDKVIQQLEQIKVHQYMLYCAVQEANSDIRKINTNIARSSNQLEDIKNNTEINNYNSKITAQNTEFLKWYNIINA